VAHAHKNQLRRMGGDDARHAQGAPSLGRRQPPRCRRR
jgi:hypothetical protein